MVSPPPPSPPDNPTMALYLAGLCYMCYMCYMCFADAQGPYAVHSSAIDFQNLHLTTHLNSQLVQSQSTSELIFSVPELIETLSMGITLQPGDVIATGTPEGVAAAHGRWLKKGDEVRIAITGLGELRNVVGDGDVPLKESEPIRPRHSVLV